MCCCFPAVIQLLQCWRVQAWQCWRVQAWHCNKEFRIEASKKDISDLLHFPRFATWGTLAGRVVIVQNPMFQTLTVVTVVLVETLAPKQANNIIHQYATHLLGKSSGVFSVYWT